MEVSFVQFPMWLLADHYNHSSSTLKYVIHTIDRVFEYICFVLLRRMARRNEDRSIRADIEMNEMRVGLQGTITTSKGIRPRRLGPTASFN